MVKNRVKISTVIENQIPRFVREDFPLVSEFLSQYYSSLESPSLPYDILNNIDQYLKVDNINNQVEKTLLSDPIKFYDKNIKVNSTKGFPDNNGLLLIKSNTITISDEIVTYEFKDDNTFYNCYRGFSGIKSYKKENIVDELEFSSTQANDYSAESEVYNLNYLLIKEFFSKLKYQFLPGFDDVELFSDLNKVTFLKQSKDFYNSKGTDVSFRVLFNALYSKPVEVVKPRDYLIQPSDAEYRITNDVVVEEISGNLEDLVNKTVYFSVTDQENIGTVNKVEKIRRGSKDYYILSLDTNGDVGLGKTFPPSFFDFYYSKIPVHPKTKIIGDINTSTKVIDVDSTIGFPRSGILVFRLEDTNEIVEVFYSGKSSTQFYNCSGITRTIFSGTEVNIDDYAYAYANANKTEEIRFRIGGVLSNVKVTESNFSLSPNDTIEIESLGRIANDIRSNFWSLNIASSYDVESILLQDRSNLLYKINLYDDSIIVNGDELILTSQSGIKYELFVTSQENLKTFFVRSLSLINQQENFVVERRLSKVKTSNYPRLNDYSANVQNVYVDDKNSTYVASHSLPNYFNQDLSVKENSVFFSGVFPSSTDDTLLKIGKHPFYTGDSVIYNEPDSSTNRLNLKNGIYFVKVIDSETIKLARSLPNIFSENYISLSGNVTNNQLRYTSFYDVNVENSNLTSLDAQNLIRLIRNPINDGKTYETSYGTVGILANGVEILNYKSEDNLFYGQIEEIIVSAPGSGYDIVNPPELIINDAVKGKVYGTNCTGYCKIVGGLDRIDIIDGGFDYKETPKIEIKGGNGKGAKAIPNLVSYDYAIDFNSELESKLVDLNGNGISFLDYHKLKNGEKVYYFTFGQTAIGGLQDESIYFVEKVDEYTIKLYKTLEECLNKINVINLTEYGVGNHTIQSFEKKKRIESVTIENSGSGYTNKKVRFNTTVDPNIINVYDDSFIIENHGFSDGDLIVYTSIGSTIGGLVSSNEYFLKRIDKDTFKLTNVQNSLSLDKKFFFNNNIFVNLSSSGSGIHEFNYPNISVEVLGNPGISTVGSQNDYIYRAILQPIFTGEIESVFLENKGVGYGSSTILNYNRSPEIILNVGSGSIIKAITSPEGSIIQVLIDNGGSGYLSPPKLNVIGDGTSAELVAVVNNGSIVDVKIIKPGIGYSNPFVEVVPNGSGASFKAIIQNWNINIVERNFLKNQITDDDSFIYRGLNSDYGYQYTHAYAPRKLRRLLLSKRVIDGEIKYNPDLIYQNRELKSSSHSPIIGWAYDGNPIYGPYSYSNNDGTGQIREMISGYVKVQKPNRPSISEYPLGIFVDDYEFNDSGDLDKFNGRYCITPEFPEGVYAYFATIELINSPSFGNYRLPVFPYFIGKEFKSQPINFNYLKESNQLDSEILKTDLSVILLNDDLDINSRFNINTLHRNTAKYNTNSKNSRYDYIFDPNKIKRQNTIIEEVTKGKIESINIISPGDNYKVGDIVLLDDFTNENDSPFGQVSSIIGKNVVSISCTQKTINDLEFANYTNNSIIGFASTSHNLNNLDLITISFKDSKSLPFAVKITTLSNRLILNNNVANSSVTGIVTYINVYGKINYPDLVENDIFLLENEKIKVLSIDTDLSRIKIQREIDGTVGSAHSAGELLNEISRKFIFNNYNENSYKLNKQIYFDPSESVSIGTGIGVTLTINNPGIGNSQIFAPSRSIYIPNHQFVDGEEVTYNSNYGSPLSISDNSIPQTYILQNNSKVYISNLGKDFIGISTLKTSIGSTTNNVYFIGIGTGSLHSLKTNYTNSLTGRIDRNEVSVSISTNHDLQNNDTVELSCIPTSTKIINVRYNDANRRGIFGYKFFNSSDVNIEKNTITIKNHNFFDGQKVVYDSVNTILGLVVNNIYYVLVVDSDTIKLTSTYYNNNEEKNIEIDLNTAEEGFIYPVNPPINFIDSQSLQFDLSDSSLSFVRNNNLITAFELNFYIDKSYKDKFEFIDSEGKKRITNFGRVGIDTIAYTKIDYFNEIPDKLYYKLDPILSNNLPASKKGIIIDSDIENSINKTISLYSGTYEVSGITTQTKNSFKYVVASYPEASAYTQNINADIVYSTNSRSAKGPIKSIELKNNLKTYDYLPRSSRFVSDSGKNALISLSSSSIGKSKRTRTDDTGFDYPSDPTLRPTGSPPIILEVELLARLTSVSIISPGKNYTLPPQILLKDSIDNKIIDDIDLNFTFNSPNIDIVKNSKGFRAAIPQVIPIRNTNGFNIQSISYNDFTRQAEITLNVVGFSTLSAFPFTLGSRVLIENVVIVDDEGYGYNSENYNYNLFTIVSNEPEIGGQNPKITISFDGLIPAGESPGEFNDIIGSGIVVPESYFPVLDISIEKNQYFIGETLKESETTRVIQSWSLDSDYLKVSTYSYKFTVGELIEGSTSKSRSFIRKIYDSQANYDVSSSSLKKKGWMKNNGFLNDPLQRLHDSDYYQYFSYSLKTTVPFDEWRESVNSLNHTSGFKNFCDLSVETTDPLSGIGTDQNEGDYTGIADLSSIIDLECVHDFDLASENYYFVDNRLVSNEIYLNSRTIQDYFESIGNRVLMVDDVSNLFNSNPRSSEFSIVDSFRKDVVRARKYILYIKDSRFTDERQLLIVTLLHDNNYGYLNQYGRVETTRSLGYFDFSIVDNEGYLVFYPIYFQRNDYTISGVSYNIKDDVVGIGSTNFGDSVFVDSDQSSLPQFLSVPTPIIGIGSTYRTSKILIEISAVDQSYFEYNELTIIHDGTNIEISEYGKLNTDNLTIDVSDGLGTYYPYYSGSNIIINFVPNQALEIEHLVDIVSVSIASTSTGIGTFNMNTAILDSSYVNIPSSPTPSGNLISKAAREFKGSYYIVSIEDKTNNRYQVSELTLIADDQEASIAEFGIIETDGNIGIFTAGVSPTTLQHELYFTPKPNINVEVRVFQNSLKVVDLANTSSIINLNNASVTGMHGSYSGTENDIVRSFNLTHKGNPIFNKVFDSEDVNIVDIFNNQLILPNHYFVTGEKITYKVPETSVLNPSGRIGIATTSISGIGVTDILPEEVYIIKLSDSAIRFAESAENALAFTPIPLQLRSTGIGSVHSIISNKQNNKVLISIDNMIQSPVVSTAVTTTLLSDALPDDTIVYFTGITSFFTNDIIKIGDEIMLIENIGIGSTSGILVRRPWLGTVSTGHTVGSIVYKLEGNFNIVDNVLNFSKAPFGKVPQTIPTNIIGPPITRPDDRDYVGITSSSSFSGRVFIRSGIEGGNEETYEKNYIFDTISNEFTGITTEFKITSNGNSISGISTSNALILVKGIFQDPSRFGPGIITGSYFLQENSGETDLFFTPRTTQFNIDPNVHLLPVGGSILAVGSSSGGGYQPLISAGGTAIVSVAGTIQAISIGNSGSGYRSGIQTTVNVSVASSSSGIRTIQNIGIASVSNGRIVGVSITNPGVGYTTKNPPEVIFDAPLSYYNLPLKYSSESSAGIGTNAFIDIVVGQKGNIIEFNLTNNGYSYGNGQILTVETGGLTGIPTDPSVPFSEFKIFIDRIYTDVFSGWTLGDIQILDKIDSLFNGSRRVFPIKYQGQQVSIRAKKGSNIDVQATLIVFINNILQVPGQGYRFRGGSTIRFAEPLPAGTTCTLMFYRGTGGIDVTEVDVLETIEIGDYVKLDSDLTEYDEDSRIVEEIISTDSIVTNVYYGPGNVEDETLLRPLEWCRQRNDVIINGSFVTKDRNIYEPLVNPIANIIQDVSVASTVIYVDNSRLFFDPLKENAADSIKYVIEIIPQDLYQSALATATVSTSGTITSINITNPGSGYTFAPSVSISGTFGYNNTQNAVAISSITNGKVTSISIVNSGSGYISTIPPQVLIQSPNFEYEKIQNVTYEGDFGDIVGVSVTTVGAGQTAIDFEIFIPFNSILRNNNFNQGITTTGISGIQTGYYFVVKNSNVGRGVTSLRNDGSIIGFATDYIDNVFQVYSVSTRNKNVYGIGNTTITSIKTRILSYDDDLLETFDSDSFTFDNNIFTFDSFNDANDYYGEFTWGKINLDPVRSRKNPTNFSSYEENGYTGITTSPLVRRLNPLKYVNYLV